MKPEVAPPSQPPDSWSMPAAILAAPLEPLDKLLWMLLEKAAFPTQADLAALLRVSRRTVQTAVSRMNRLDWLAILPRQAGRRNRYVALKARQPESRMLAILARVRGPAVPYRPTGEQLFLRSESYQTYLRTFCRKRTAR